MRTLALRAKFKVLRHISMWNYARVLGKTIPIQVSTDNTPTLTAAMLCGQSSFRKGIGAAKSFFRFFTRDHTLHWHDDGSLSVTAQSMIRRHLPGVRIILRKDADEVVQLFLEKNRFKRLAEFRKQHVLALKLIDTCFFARGRLLLFDSDVLCLQFPTELLAAMKHENFTTRFNKDFGPATAYHASNLEEFLGRPIQPCFNTGLVLTSVPDVTEFCYSAERLLEKQYQCLRSWLVEQTLWAAWCTTKGAEPLPDEYDCTFRYAKAGFCERERVITQHYCAFSSMLFFEDFVSKVYPRLLPSTHLAKVVVTSINSGIFDVTR